MPRLPRVSPAAAIGLALAALACVFTFVPFFDFDTWWHLRTGEHIVTQLKIPDQDLYSHTVPGPWVNHQWLAQVVYYLVDQAFGLTGIRVLNSAAAGACAWLLWRLYLKGTGALLPALFAISLILPDFLGRFNHRPEMFSLPLTVALVSLLIATPGPLALTPRRLAALAGIAILWANLHAMAVTGVIFLAAYAGGEVATLMVRPWFDPGEWGGVTRRSTLWLVGATAAVAVAVLLTPIRGEIYAYVMHSRDHLIEGPLQIAEWRPSLGVLAAISGQVARSGASWVPVELAFRFLYLAIPIGFFVAVPYLASRRELPSFGGLLLAVVTIYMGVSAVRLRWMFFVPIFYIARALALAIRSTLEARSPEEDNKGGRTIANLVIIPGMVMFIAIGLYTVTRADVSLRKDYHDETYPIGSATFLNELDIGGNLFNPYNWGGYLIYRVTPRYKVFIDGRTIHYTSHPNVVRDYIAIERQTAGFEKLLDLYNVDVIAQSRRDYFPRGLMAAEMSFARKPSPETSHATANAQAAINAAVIAVPAAVTAVVNTPTAPNVAGGGVVGAPSPAMGGGAFPAPAGTPSPAGDAPGAHWIPLLVNQEGAIYLSDRPSEAARIERVAAFFNKLGIAWSRQDGPDLAALLRRNPQEAVRFRVMPAALWETLQHVDVGDEEKLAAARLRWAQTLFTLGLYRDAAIAYDAVLETQRYSEAALGGSAYCHHLLGENTEARALLERFALFGTDPAIRALAQHSEVHTMPAAPKEGSLPTLELLLREWAARPGAR